MAFDVGSVVAHINADITGFQDGLQKAEQGVYGFGNKIEGVADKLQKLTLIGIAAGAGIAAIFTKESIDAASKAQVEMGKFNTLINNSKKPTDALKKSILAAADAAVKLGFDDEDVAISIARFYQRTGDLTQSLKLNKIAMDLSRDKTMDLTTAQQMVGLVLSGNGRALKQYGIDLKESATPMEAIEELQTKVANSSFNFSQTYAGSLARMNVETTNLKETVGAAFLPILTNVTTKVSDIVNNVIQWETKTHAVENALTTLKDTIVLVGEFYDKHKAVINDLVTFITIIFLPALVSVAIQMGLNMVNAIISATFNLALFIAQGWLSIAMLVAKAWQLGVATAAFIVHTVVTIAQTIATGALTAATWLFNAALAVLTSPIFLVIAAIIALIAIGLWLIAHWDDVKKAAAAVWVFIKQGWDTLVTNLEFVGQKVLDAIMWPFNEAKKRIEGVVNWIKDKLDFTQRHSPSVVDIVKNGVSKVNDALSDLAYNADITSTSAGASVNYGGSNTSTIVVKVDMAGAFIGDQYSAMSMAELMGDSIIQKLKQNVRV